MKPLAVPLASLALAAALTGGLAAPGSAQSAPPAAATPVPWQPRPVIIIDPRAYLATPSPTPRPTPRASRRPSARAVLQHQPTPHASAAAAHRPAPSATRTPETFERIDTSPPPSAPPRG